MNKRSVLIFTLIASFIFLVACGEEEEEVIAPFEPDEESEQEDKEIDDEIDDEKNKAPSYDHHYPLTGKGTDDDVDYRAMGVMIENSLNARPQSGLTEADVVYEVLAEGTVTRFLAFYHSQDVDRIGPVRSARDYFIHLNNGYDAVYASAGGSPDAFDMIARGQVAHLSGLNYDGVYFERDHNRSAPHNLYTDTDRLYEGAEQRGFDLSRTPPELPFIDKSDNDEDRSIDGEEASAVTIQYGSNVNNVRYEYEEEDESYHRINGGVAIEDAETGDAVAPENVMIVEAPHRTIDDQGRRSIDIHSGGRALLVQKGKVQEIEWRNEDGVILPYDGGTLAALNPGQTWLNIVPSANGGIDHYVDIDGEESAEGF
ncbi:DUF3048 domain-containing protein [Texcoconibacillus texcoconensis]|uniref:Lipoprotein YerB n=1 Tax=Texcoconibacillus texcoconensis TaxID=1095777 RepID=A0A840QMI2_9BACI|nr:DUF3048 domain-containing protein [Texcoconibacillus texcoconensis]MBB5172553.1 hypothetical protein [Texcoconibacillus texcoconensis]